MNLTTTIALDPDAAGRRRRRRLGVSLGIVTALGICFFFPMQAYLAFFFPLMLPTSTWMLSGSWALGLVLGPPSAAVVLLGGYLILMALAPRKGVVLYLRRFRLTLAAHAMSEAIESGIGRHYRILTLDDASFVPIEVPRLERWMSRYGSLVPTLGGAAAFLAVWWATARVFARYGYSLSGLGVLSGLVFSGFLVMVVQYEGFMLVFWIILLVPAFLIHRRRVRNRSRIPIETRNDLSACVEYGRTLSGKLRAPAFLAPQATVVKVVDTLWQDTVYELARTADAILIDVSAPTVHVLWEIETAIRDFPSKIIYLGQKALTEEWIQAKDGADAAAGAALRERLEGATMLAYEPVRRSARRQFRRSLRNALDNVGIPKRTRFDVPASWKGIKVQRRTLLPALWKVFLLYAGLAAVCLPLSAAVWAVLWHRLLAGFAAP